MNSRYTSRISFGLRVTIFSTILGTSAFGDTIFQPLGHLPGGSSSTPYAVSADGSTVVGQASSSSGPQAFRWTAQSGIVGLGDLPSGPFHSEGWGVSADGSVVAGEGMVEVNGLFQPQAFRWTAAAGMVGLPDLPGGIAYSRGRGISSDGSVIVGSSNSSAGYVATRWTDAGAESLGDLPGGGTSSAASGASADGGVIVGTGRSASGTEAFRWTASNGMMALGDLPGGSFESFARGVSADGSVVVGWSASTQTLYEAFRWTASTGMVSLGFLPGGDESIAQAASADGQTIVGLSSSGATGGAFVWTPAQGMRALRSILVNDFGVNLTGWTLEAAQSVSADGQTIVGWGFNPAGEGEGWIARIPEPISSTLLVIAVASYLIRRR
jgi:probable HAF family extracellular repeat protein